MPAPPTTSSVHSNPNPNRRPAASSTETAPATTSGPTPSPGMRATRKLITLFAPGLVIAAASRLAPSEVRGGAPRRHRPEDSRQVLGRPAAHERDRDAVDLRAVELVRRGEVRLQRRLDDVRAQPVAGDDERPGPLVGR